VAGLDETKRLNIAREWLLDPALRATLPKPPPVWRAQRPDPTTAPGPAAEPQQPPPQQQPPPPRTSSRPRRESSSWWDGVERPRWEYDPNRDDPLTFDYGDQSSRLQEFFNVIRGLSKDERARVTYSLGDEPPFFFDEFKKDVSQTLWSRSEALDDAIAQVWAEREEEDRPLLFPSGRVFGSGAVVANAYAQWILLAEAIRRRSRDPATVEALASRSAWPWAPCSCRSVSVP
jgi:hypothetical protein